MSRKIKSAISIVIIVSVFFSSWIFAAASQKKIQDIYEQQYHDPILMLLYFIDNIYYDKSNIDYEKILDSTLDGLISGLDDPFAWYFDKRQTNENRIEESKEYGGVGLTVRYDTAKKAIVVVSPMSGTPGEKAGILPNDYIITVDGSPVSQIGYTPSVDRMRGEPGTAVKLEVFRDGWEETKIIEVPRAKIETKSVQYDLIEYNNKKIAYIRLTNFAEKSYEEMQTALSYFISKSKDGLVLDLRSNPGGFLNVAIDIGSMFVRNGKIVSVRYYNGEEETVIPEPEKYVNFLKDIPIVVLVNKGSASASEILTGALKDNGIATIIGKQTYGKAAVQRPIQLPNGGEVWLPIGHYFTPNGTDIHLKGIEPDINIDNPAVELKSVKPSESETTEAMLSTTNKPYINLSADSQLLKAFEVITEKSGGK